MFPQLRERIGPALDLVVEFSTLGEYRLGADGVLCPASAPTAVAPERVPQMGGAGVSPRRACCGAPHRRGRSGRPSAGRDPRGRALRRRRRCRGERRRASRPRVGVRSSLSRTRAVPPSCPRWSTRRGRRSSANRPMLGDPLEHGVEGAVVGARRFACAYATAPLAGGRGQLDGREQPLVVGVAPRARRRARIAWWFCAGLRERVAHAGTSAPSCTSARKRSSLRRAPASPALLDRAGQEDRATCIPTEPSGWPDLGLPQARPRRSSGSSASARSRSVSGVNPGTRQAATASPATGSYSTRSATQRSPSRASTTRHSPPSSPTATKWARSSSMPGRSSTSTRCRSS